MKKLIFTVLLLSSQAFAANFLKDSEIPTDLQNEIAAAVAQKYPCITSLSEERTEVNYVHIDQGVVDHYFSTRMRGWYLFDGTHLVEVELSVQSAHYDFSNGKNIEVFTVEPVGGLFSCPQ